jgi:hypothetical protein
VPIMAGVGQVWGHGRGGQQGGGNQKLRFGHFDSPEVLPETIAISSWTDSRACVKEKSTSKQHDRRLASDSVETCAGLELGGSDFAFQEKRLEKLRKTTLTRHFWPQGMLNEFPTQSGQSSAVLSSSTDRLSRV